MLGSPRWASCSRATTSINCTRTPTMKTKQALDALDKAIALIGTELARSDDEFTITEYAERANLSIPQACSILRKKTAEGLLVMRKSRVNGKSTNMYSVAN